MAYNLSAWMSDATIQAKTLTSLVIPGTHDSGTYGLTTQLSAIQYPNIAFLWNLYASSAPVNGTLPWKNTGSDGHDTYYIGPEAYNFIMGCIRLVSQSQSSSDTIKAQLDNGIRFFDLRVYYDSATPPFDYYIQHALRGPLLQTILDDVKSFVDEGNKEIVFLQLSHTNFNSGNVSDIVNMLQTTLPGAIYTPIGTNLHTALSDVTLSGIAGSGTKVIVLNGDSGVTYPSHVFNGTFSSTRDPNGVDTVEALENRELNGLKLAVANTMYGISWILTPQTPDIIASVIPTLISVTPAQPLLETLAQLANTTLYDFIKSVYPTYPFNLITCDWYQQTGSNPDARSVVELAIEISSDTFS
ncbi:MAG TPA: hypothetical protein VK609_18860 [Mucilaginibacter sp.]|nr:hypothetical protein [Mucilaginibacter sp.]